MAFTYFFRDLQTIEGVVVSMLPFVSGRKRVNVWDAGCAMGPEPYTLAIIFAENMGYFGFKNLTIYASDIDEQDTFGPTVQAGIYPEAELERIPKPITEKYFRPNGKPGHLQIVDAIRERIVFRKHNLLSLEPIATDFSLVLCKNVLLHFQPDERVRVIGMFHSALLAGGYFGTEQTQKMPKEIEHLFEKVAPDGQIFKKIETGK
jgi:chemotaxis protein methyltransferase CheR